MPKFSITGNIGYLEEEKIAKLYWWNKVIQHKIGKYGTTITTKYKKYMLQIAVEQFSHPTKRMEPILCQNTRRQIRRQARD